MKKSLILLVLFVVQLAVGQNEDYAAIDRQIAAIPQNMTTTTTGIATYINSNFKTDNEKIRAVFYWVSSNISYDVSKMRPESIGLPQEKIKNTLKTRKGVCVHYSLLFNDIANKLGIKTVIVPGYTNYRGELATVPHAWCASKIDGKWFVFDPTWAAGFTDGKKFIRKLNNAFYKTEPRKMIATHMPFDYLWQFLKSPVTHQEFMDSAIDASRPKMNFNFEAAIEDYERLSDADKAFESAARVEEIGLSNEMVAEYYAMKKQEFTVLNQNKSVEKLIAITADFNEAVRGLNDFITLRNRKFKPSKSDDALRKMIRDVKDKLSNCKNDLSTVGAVSAENSANFNSLKSSISKAFDKTKEQDDFLNDYLRRKSFGRR